MPTAPHGLSISAARADALFASPLQRSDEPSARQVRQAIATAIAAYGVPLENSHRVWVAFGGHETCPRPVRGGLAWRGMVAAARVACASVLPGRRAVPRRSQRQGVPGGGAGVRSRFTADWGARP